MHRKPFHWQIQTDFKRTSCFYTVSLCLTIKSLNSTNLEFWKRAFLLLIILQTVTFKLLPPVWQRVSSFPLASVSRICWPTHMGSPTYVPTLSHPSLRPRLQKRGHLVRTVWREHMKCTFWFVLAQPSFVENKRGGEAEEAEELPHGLPLWVWLTGHQTARSHPTLTDTVFSDGYS